MHGRSDYLERLGLIDGFEKFLMDYEGWSYPDVKSGYAEEQYRLKSTHEVSVGEDYDHSQV